MEVKANLKYIRVSPQMQISHGILLEAKKCQMR